MRAHDVDDQRIDQIVLKVQHHLGVLEDEIVRLKDEIDDLKKKQHNIEKSFRSERPWELRSILTNDEIEFLSQFGGWGKDI